MHNETTITNARGQERPATYAPREHPALDAEGGRGGRVNARAQSRYPMQLA